MKSKTKIFTPEYRIVGEFITLGTLYNDMGIDCMEINDIQITPDRGYRGWAGEWRGSTQGGLSALLRNSTLLHSQFQMFAEENVNILFAKMLTSI